MIESGKKYSIKHQISGKYISVQNENDSYEVTLSDQPYYFHFIESKHSHRLNISVSLKIGENQYLVANGDGLGVSQDSMDFFPGLLRKDAFNNLKASQLYFKPTSGGPVSLIIDSSKNTDTLKTFHISQGGFAKVSWVIEPENPTPIDLEDSYSSLDVLKNWTAVSIWNADTGSCIEHAGYGPWDDNSSSYDIKIALKQSRGMFQLVNDIDGSKGLASQFLIRHLTGKYLEIEQNNAVGTSKITWWIIEEVNGQNTQGASERNMPERGKPERGIVEKSFRSRSPLHKMLDTINSFDISSKINSAVSSIVDAVSSTVDYESQYTITQASTRKLLTIEKTANDELALALTDDASDPKTKWYIKHRDIRWRMVGETQFALKYDDSTNQDSEVRTEFLGEVVYNSSNTEVKLDFSKEFDENSIWTLDETLSFGYQMEINPDLFSIQSTDYLELSTNNTITYSTKKKVEVNKTVPTPSDTNLNAVSVYADIYTHSRRFHLIFEMSAELKGKPVTGDLLKSAFRDAYPDLEPFVIGAHHNTVRLRIPGIAKIDEIRDPKIVFEQKPNLQQVPENLLSGNSPKFLHAMASGERRSEVISLDSVLSVGAQDGYHVQAIAQYKHYLYITESNGITIAEANTLGFGEGVAYTSTTLSEDMKSVIKTAYESKQAPLYIYNQNNKEQYTIYLPKGYAHSCSLQIVENYMVVTVEAQYGALEELFKVPRFKKAQILIYSLDEPTAPKLIHQFEMNARNSGGAGLTFHPDEKRWYLLVDQDNGEQEGCIALYKSKGSSITDWDDMPQAIAKYSRYGSGAGLNLITASDKSIWGLYYDTVKPDTIDSEVKYGIPSETAGDFAMVPNGDIVRLFKLVDSNGMIIHEREVFDQVINLQAPLFKYSISEMLVNRPSMRFGASLRVENNIMELLICQRDIDSEFRIERISIKPEDLNNTLVRFVNFSETDNELWVTNKDHQSGDKTEFSYKYAGYLYLRKSTRLRYATPIKADIKYSADVLSRETVSNVWTLLTTPIDELSKAVDEFRWENIGTYHNLSSPLLLIYTTGIQNPKSHMVKFTTQKRAKQAKYTGSSDTLHSKKV